MGKIAGFMTGDVRILPLESVHIMFGPHLHLVFFHHSLTFCVCLGCWTSPNLPFCVNSHCVHCFYTSVDNWA